MSFSELSPRVDIISSPEAQRPDLAFGVYLPKTILTNQEIESWNILTPGGHILTAESIEKRTGVTKRYVADKSETPFSMALHASQEALALRQSKTDIDAVIVSTSFPTGENLSSKLQNEFGISGFHLDVHAACSGFTLSLAYIKEHEKEFLGKKILFVATEKYSPYLHDLKSKGVNSDPSLAQTIFSDGAVAIVFEYGKDLEVISATNKNFPEVKDSIKMPIDRILLKPPFLEIAVPYAPSGKLEQDGTRVYRAICENIPQLIKKTIEEANLDPSPAIQMIVPHQGSGHMVEGISQRLNGYFVYRDFEEGNFSSASIPRSLNKAFEKGEIKKGNTVVLAGFGAGLFASIVVAKFG